MDAEAVTLEEKCEHLMNVVVESRKKFGKMCTEYDQKATIVENKLLNLKVETISGHQFKPKQTIPVIDMSEMDKDLNEYISEMEDKQKRIDSLESKVRKTQQVVMQLKNDNLARKMKQPITTEAMLDRAKNKKKW